MHPGDKGSFPRGFWDLHRGATECRRRNAALLSGDSGELLLQHHVSKAPWEGTNGSVKFCFMLP